LFHFREPNPLARAAGGGYYAQSMSAKRVVIYMPDELGEALNRATESSPKSRSEIICAAVQQYLTRDAGAPVAEPVSADEAFFDRVAEMMQSGLLQPGDFSESAADEPRPKSKLWIN
jgi:hypothetical protein